MGSSDKCGEQLSTELEFMRARLADLERQQTFFARMEKRFRHSQQMEAIGQLASGVAHNINNILTGIIGNLSIAYLKSSSEVSPYVSKAMDESYRVANLINDLLAFSRISELALSPLDVNSIVLDVYDLMRKTLDSRIDLAVQLGQEIPKVMADRSQLKTVLMNLCMNSQEAITRIQQENAFSERRDDSFAITLKTCVESLDEQSCENVNGIFPGKYVILSVADNGIGIQEQSYPHIFEPFFSTKETVGTGLGLASAFGSIQQQGGVIDFVSQYGLGSTFRVYLPVLEEENASLTLGSNRSQSLAPSQEKCILIIDDEAMILSLCKGILEELGYRILLAENGRVGWDLYQKEQGRIDLILLDLSMPVVTGWEFLKMIRSSGSTVKVVVSSGYAKSVDFGSLQELGADGLISKPYYPRDLVQTIRKYLDGDEKEEG